MSALVIDAVARRFEQQRALDGVSLRIGQGEFFSLLGPSGCGKTTLLNIIAGFLAPDSGRVWLGGEDVTALAPYRRHIGMVFQNYALFPHLSVAENVAFGLKVRRLPQQKQRERVDDVLKQVRLEGMASRRPHQLSGGQQQRVAIARALAIRPQVLLLDEPLSNLDARLRRDMQDELRALQQRVGITTVLVTHDQEEALTLSDRIGILGHGQLQQVGTPAELYRQPQNRFVAEFIGEANLFTVTPDAGGQCYLAQPHDATTPLRLAAQQFIPQATLLMVRPERIRLSASAPASVVNASPAQVVRVSFAGATLRLLCRLPGGAELQVQPAEQDFAALPAVGQTLTLHWHPDDVIVLPAGKVA